MKNKRKLKSTLQKVSVIFAVVAILTTLFVIPANAAFYPQGNEVLIDAGFRSWSQSGSFEGANNTESLYLSSDELIETTQIGSNEYVDMNKAICYYGMDAGSYTKGYIRHYLYEFEKILQENKNSSGYYSLKFGIWTRPDIDITATIFGDSGDGYFEVGTAKGVFKSSGTGVRGYYRYFNIFFPCDPSCSYLLQLDFTPTSTNEMFTFSGTSPLYSNSFIAFTEMIYSKSASYIPSPYKKNSVIKYGEVYRGSDLAEVAYLLFETDPKMVYGSFTVNQDGDDILYNTSDFNTGTAFFNSDYTQAYFYAPVNNSYGYLYNVSVGFGPIYEQLALGNDNPIVMYQNGYNDAQLIYKSYYEGIIEENNNNWQARYDELSKSMSGSAQSQYNKGYTDGYSANENNQKNLIATIDSLGTLIQKITKGINSVSIFGITPMTVLLGSFSIIAGLAIIRRFKN